MKLGRHGHLFYFSYSYHEVARTAMVDRGELGSEQWRKKTSTGSRGQIVSGGASGVFLFPGVCSSSKEPADQAAKTHKHCKSNRLCWWKERPFSKTIENFNDDAPAEMNAT